MCAAAPEGALRRGTLTFFHEHFEICVKFILLQELVYKYKFFIVHVRSLGALCQFFYNENVSQYSQVRIVVILAVIIAQFSYKQTVPQ